MTLRWPGRPAQDQRECGAATGRDLEPRDSPEDLGKGRTAEDMQRPERSEPRGDHQQDDPLQHRRRRGRCRADAGPLQHCLPSHELPDDLEQEQPRCLSSRGCPEGDAPAHRPAELSQQHEKANTDQYEIGAEEGEDDRHIGHPDGRET